MSPRAFLVLYVGAIGGLLEWNKWSRRARNRLARSLQMGVKLTTNHAFPPRDRALFPKTTNYRQRRRFAEVATMRVSSTPLLPALLQLYVAGCVRRSVAQRPLFTGVRGRLILRSPDAGSCMDYPVGPTEGRLARATSIEANTTYSGAG